MCVFLFIRSFLSVPFWFCATILFVSLFVWLAVRLSLCLSVCMSAYTCVCEFIIICLVLYLHVLARVCLCLSVCRSVFLCLLVCFSVCVGPCVCHQSLCLIIVCIVQTVVTRQLHIETHAMRIENNKHL